jgi:AcrR family transcriptional regulator
MREVRSEAAERILDSAMRLFAERGYERTAIPDIQAAVGLSRGSGALYKHFESKEALLVAIVDRFVAAAEAAQSQLADIDLPPKEALAWIGRTTLRMMAEHKDKLRIFWRDLDPFPELQRRVRKRVMQATYQGVAAWLEREHKLGNLEVIDTRAAAAVLVGSLTMFRAFDALWGERAINVADSDFLRTWEAFAEKALGISASAARLSQNQHAGSVLLTDEET